MRLVLSLYMEAHEEPGVCSSVKINARQCVRDTSSLVKGSHLEEGGGMFHVTLKDEKDPDG